MRQAGFPELDGQVLEFFFSIDKLMRIGIVGVLQGKAAIDIIEHGLSFPDTGCRLPFILVPGVGTYRRAT